MVPATVRQPAGRSTVRMTSSLVAPSACRIASSCRATRGIKADQTEQTTAASETPQTANTANSHALKLHGAVARRRIVQLSGNCRRPRRLVEALGLGTNQPRDNARIRIRADRQIAGPP